jgi:hypothetical protein
VTLPLVTVTGLGGQGHPSKAQYSFISSKKMSAELLLVVVTLTVIPATIAMTILVTGISLLEVWNESTLLRTKR